MEAIDFFTLSKHSQNTDNNRGKHYNFSNFKLFVKLNNYQMDSSQKNQSVNSCPQENNFGKINHQLKLTDLLITCCRSIWNWCDDFELNAASQESLPKIFDAIKKYGYKKTTEDIDWFKNNFLAFKQKNEEAH
jgi:hypothetical protein